MLSKCCRNVKWHALLISNSTMLVTAGKCVVRRYDKNGSTNVHQLPNICPAHIRFRTVNTQFHHYKHVKDLHFNHCTLLAQSFSCPPLSPLQTCESPTFRTLHTSRPIICMPPHSIPPLQTRERTTTYFSPYHLYASPLNSATTNT